MARRATTAHLAFPPRAVLVTPAVLLAAGCSAFVPGPKPWDGSTADTDADQWADGDVVELPTECTPDERACFDNDEYRCSDGGLGWDLLNECLAGQVCVDGSGCQRCTEGQRVCMGNVSYMCDHDESLWLWMRDCTEWSASCIDGYCNDACAASERARSHEGCEFWAPPLPNPYLFDSESFDLGVFVTNPSATHPATVRITRGAIADDVRSVAPGETLSLSLDLPIWVTSTLVQGNWHSYVLSDAAYRITSDIPVAVSQIVPEGYNSHGTNALTSGGSLLLPLSSLSSKYVVSGTPVTSANDTSGAGTEKWATYFSIVATAPGTTSVRVELGMHLASDQNGHFSSASYGDVVEFTMQQYEAAHMACAVPPDCTGSSDHHVEVGGIHYCYDPQYDPSGTRIVTDQPVAVFGGAVNQRVPFYADEPDHMQEQLPPEAALGTIFVLAPMTEPGSAAPGRIRIGSIYPNTQVWVIPEQDGFGTGTMGEGETIELELASPAVVESDRPVLLIQNMVGHDATDPPTAMCDPAMTVVVPVQQYACAYEFFVPADFDPTHGGRTFVMVVRPPGEQVSLDGVLLPLTGWVGAGGPPADWEVGMIELFSGQHVLECGQPFGAQIFGLGEHAGFAHPAGMNLEWINIQS